MVDAINLSYITIMYHRETFFFLLSLGTTHELEFMFLFNKKLIYYFELLLCERISFPRRLAVEHPLNIFITVFITNFVGFFNFSVFVYLHSGNSLFALKQRLKKKSNLSLIFRSSIPSQKPP